MKLPGLYVYPGNFIEVVRVIYPNLKIGTNHEQYYLPTVCSCFEACIDGRLIMYSAIKSGITCIQCEFTKCVECTGRKSKIVPGMIR